MPKRRRDILYAGCYTLVEFFLKFYLLMIMTGQQYFKEYISTFSVVRSISAYAFAVLSAALFAAAIPAVFYNNGTVTAAESHIIAQKDIAPLGLSRVWFNQIALDPVRSKAVHAILEGNTIFVVSDNATLTAIDSVTGKTLWVRGLGERDSFYQEPAANSRMVAVQNAKDLFVFDRRNGKLLLSVSLPGSSSTSCEISENYVYIPMIDGRLVAYPLADRETLMSDDSDAKDGNKAGGEQTDSAQADTEENADNAAAKPMEKDEVLENIKNQFAKAKSELYPVEKPEPKEVPIILQKISSIPLITQSFGIITVKPKIASQIVQYTATNLIKNHSETVTWVNDRGFFLAANINALSRDNISLQYKVDTSGQSYFLGSDRIAKRELTQGKEIVSQPVLNQCVPAYYDSRTVKEEPIAVPSTILFGTKTGFVIAVKDRTGEVLWQFAVSGPVIERIGIIGTDVYAATTEGLHSVDIFTGDEKWFTRGIVRFVAASKTRIYGIDRDSRLIALDRETGQVLRSFNVRKYGKVLFNIETDRLYLMTETGLIQSLAERQPQEDTSDTVPVVQHRYTCAQNVELFHGSEVPELYWLKDIAKQDKMPESENAEEKTADTKVE